MIKASSKTSRKVIRLLLLLLDAEPAHMAVVNWGSIGFAPRTPPKKHRESFKSYL